ncbi:alpha/beta hydrolase [Micromonospora sp. KC606]|uniref:alpha/beta fold hydrolase n=1 Tax=Micromonospora sp. KC606 TaxID=2530379 RepID=UPI001045979E|nr:alpha/beta hydrolase [Micromonospora sp. KC606]TDC84298.1 alpha/beta hydrolase [Micromonospora sp. KC606]
MAELTLPAGALRYRDTGGGEPVVFLHGLLQDGRVWEPLVERLRPDFRCIVPDLPLGAHRAPMRPDVDLSIKGVGQVVADLIEALGVRQVTLVGNDTGGAIAQIVAVRHAERIGRLVLTSCEAFDNFPPPIFRMLAPAARVGVLSVILVPLRSRAPRRLPSGYGRLTHEPLPHHLIDDWIAAYFSDSGIRRDTRAFVASLGERNLLCDIAEELAGFTKPALVAWAADDRLFPVSHAERLALALPDARVVLIERSRTWVMRDQPQRTAELIRDFIRGTE